MVSSGNAIKARSGAISKQFKILVVDDKKENLVALRTVLKDLDVDIIEATSGNEALTATLYHHFALALLDVMMPGMDGYELARHLRDDPKTARLPIIFLTAISSDEDYIFKGYQAGAVDYIVKPYNPDILLAKISIFLELEAARSESEKRIHELEQIELERKQAEEELKKSKALLNATGRMARVGGWELDSDTMEVTWTEETYHIHEVPLFSKPPLQEAINYFHPEDRPKLECAVKRALDHGEPYDMELRFITAKGNHLWTRTKCQPEILDGKIVKLRGTFQDITPRKQAEQKYNESVIKLKEAVRSGNVGLWDWNLVNNKVYYSPEWKRQIGYSDDEITNDFDEWRARVHPDDLDRTFEKIQKGIDEASKENIVEFRFMHKDGSYRWILAHSSIILDENDKPVRMVGSHTDITEQKKVEEQLRQSEKRLRQSLDATPFPIAMTGLEDDKILFWSQSALDLFGHIAETISEWYEVAYPDLEYRQFVIAKWESYLEEARKSGKPVNTGEYKISCKDGSECICEIYATFLKNNLIVTFNDITRQKTFENELKDHQEHLEKIVEKRTIAVEKKNKELEMFTYSVSHDLKAPLRGIDGYSRLLVEEYSDKLDEEGLFFLNNVRQGATQMNKLIEDLLAYSRMERKDLHLTAIDLNSLIENLVDQRTHDIEQCRIKVTVDLPFNTINSDTETLRQVLDNYLDNAIKYSKKDMPGMVTIGGRQDDEYWTLWVKDTGIGFDPKYLDRIFEIFQRLHRVEEYPGTGVGLAIVRKAVERIGGRVHADSTPGKGATFYLDIPKSNAVTS